MSPGPGKNGSTWTGRGTGLPRDEDDGFDDNYFRRRPKSFYFEGRKLCPPDAGGVRMSHVAMGDAENYFRSMTLGYPRPGVTRPEMFLSQDTLTSLHSVHTTQPNTPDLLLHRKAVREV